MSTTYYVTAGAAGGGNGTSASSPWNSLSSVTNFSGFKSGDTVELSGTFSGQTLTLGTGDAGLTVTSANPSSPATITEAGSSSFNSNAISVDAGGVTLSYLNVTGPGIKTSSNSYFGILFENNTSAQFSGDTVTHVNESGFVYAGLDISGGSNYSNNGYIHGYSNFTVADSTFSDNQVSGIISTGITTTTYSNGSFSTPAYSNYNITINNCVANGNAGDDVANGAGYADNGGIFLADVSGATVEHCTAYDDCYNSAGGVAIWAFGATNVTFEYDEAYGTQINGNTDGDGFDFDWDVTNSIMEYDYSHDNAGAGFLMCTVSSSGTMPYPGTSNQPTDNSGNVIRYDVAWNNGLKDNYAGIDLYGGSSSSPFSNEQIYGNTVGALSDATNGTPSAFRAQGNESGTTYVANNILYTTGSSHLVSTSDASTSTLKLEGNDYAATGTFSISFAGSSYGTLSAFRTGQPGEEVNSSGAAIGLSVDPGLPIESTTPSGTGYPTETSAGNTSVPQYKLPAGSPLIDAGQNLTASPYSFSVGIQDFYGDAVPQGAGFDIGADETTPTASYTGTISGTVFNDNNADGVDDSGDTAASGVTVYLDSNDDGVQDDGEYGTTTNAAGQFSFGTMPNGTYNIREVVPSGQEITTSGVDDDLATVTNGGAVTGLVFGNAVTSSLKGSISGTVFNDANGNGIKDAGEAGVAGVTVYLDLNKDGVQDDGEYGTTTNSAGQFSFGSMPNETFEIREVLPSGQQLTTPAVDTATVTNGGAVTGLVFGNRSTAGNLLTNGGFESGSLSPFTLTNSATPAPTISTTNVYAGSYDVAISATDSGINYTVTGLTAGATYTFSAYVDAASSNDGIYVGVENYGGSNTADLVTTTSYSLGQVTFTLGANNTSAYVYLWKQTGSSTSYADDLSLVAG